MSAKREDPVEPVQWVYTESRGFVNPVVKAVRGLMFRCTYCGAIYRKYKEAREHAVFECQEKLK